MNRSIASRHIEEVIAYASVAELNTAQTADAVIKRSWRRCVQDHGLDPTRAQPAQIIEAGQLRHHQERAEAFLRVARGGLEKLFKLVSPLGYVLLLTDAQGVAVDYIGNDTWDRDLRKSGLYLGADWNESHAGTCAVGTCIVERLPLTCHRLDHFDATHIGLTCTAAPLFDPTGEFMGVLDVSALTSPEQRDSQHLVRHLTGMFGQMIEDAHFLRHFSDHTILRLGKDWTLVNVSGEYMLAIGGDGRIVGANSGARQAPFARGGNDGKSGLIGRHLSEVFRDSNDDMWQAALSSTAPERVALTTHEHLQLYAMVTPPRRRIKSLAPAAGAADETDAVLHCPALDSLAGNDKQMNRLIDQAKRLVDKRVNILLHGETGTGKEVVARALHDSSTRSKHSFVAVNCAAIPDSLIESELFGYSPGSFTGGRAKGMRGLILQSDKGTLFLDEIGDMPLQLQTRLLRVISEREVLPLGADKPVPVDLAVIAASHRDLRRLIADGVFREDLYYRLCGATLQLPPLRARADRRFIIERILEQESEQMGFEGELSEEAMQLLLQHSWPGNIRQLRNVIRFALAVSCAGKIRAANLPLEVHEDICCSQHSAAAENYSDTARPVTNDPTGALPSSSALVSVLRRHHWNITAVAKELDICRATVYRHMKRLGIVPPTHL